MGALFVGFARGVELALSDAMILDTIVHAIASIVNILPQSLKAIGMFLAQSLVNCVITSGTGQAAVTMPLMVPVADLIGITRQTAVLAFQLCADGLSRRFEDPVCKMVKIHDAVIPDLDILRMSVHAWGTHDRLLRRRKREDAGF